MRGFSRKSYPPSSPLERWFWSRRRFPTFGAATFYLPCQSAPDARIRREAGSWVIRSSDGRYLLHGDLMDFPLGESDEVRELPCV
jgi:hypothetical protein